MYCKGDLSRTSPFQHWLKISINLVVTRRHTVETTTNIPLKAFTSLSSSHLPVIHAALFSNLYLPPNPSIAAPPHAGPICQIEIWYTLWVACRLIPISRADLKSFHTVSFCKCQNILLLLGLTSWETLNLKKQHAWNVSASASKAHEQLLFWKQ